MHTFRIALPADALQILTIAREAYGPRGWTVESEAWVRAALVSPGMRCFLGKRCFGFVNVYRPFWEERPIAWLQFFGSMPGSDLEPLALLRHAIDYAREAGCASIHGGTEPGEADTSVLWRRVGAQPYELFKVTFPCHPSSPLPR